MERGVTRAGVALTQELVRKRKNIWLEFVERLVKTKPLGLIGGVIVVIIGLMAAFAPWITPYSFEEINTSEALQSYSLKHWLGTDEIGRDLFTRVVFGARISLMVGFFTLFLMLPFAVLLGIASGYFGGRFDMLVQRIVDAVLSFPYLVFLLALVAVFQPGLWTIILALAFLSIWGSSRIIRGAAMSVKHNQFVDAAKSIGAGDMRILLRHVLPNVFAPIIVIATINVGGFILAEASISFLGFGVPPPTPTWGGMLSGAGLYYMYDAPWLALWPGIFLSLTVFGFNMLGDAMRDLLDPRLRRA